MGMLDWGSGKGKGMRKSWRIRALEKFFGWSGERAPLGWNGAVCRD